MVYSFHHFYYWLRGGVESGMAYRAKIFRKMGVEAKFVFATTFPNDNIQHETERLGFLDSEVIWLYSFFTDCRLSPVIYTLDQLEESFEERNYIYTRDGKAVKYQFPDTNSYYVAELTDETSDCVHSVVRISNGCLLRKDYYTYCRIYSEYYAPYNSQAKIYLRRFFNEDGTVAYEEVMGDETAADDVVLYKFPDRLIYSREELVGYMMSRLHITKDDVVLIDGEPGKIDRAAFIQNAYPARVGFILHSNHFIKWDEEHIQWYGIYEYALSHPEKIDFYITSTERQSNLLTAQFMQYKGIEPRVETIPVAGLNMLHIPQTARKKHSLITAGRLAADKRTDWVVRAVVEAKNVIPDLSLDIYGEGSGEVQIRKLIEDLDCSEYIHLCGFQKLDEVYQNYEAYVSASYGETFGVTLLEAIGSGLAVIGFDLPYGIQVFVDDGKNGYKIRHETIQELTGGIVRLFTEDDLEKFRNCSYKKAKYYLTEEVEKKWKTVLNLER
jgi:accessory Sec system glycosylation protein GtfA